MQENLLSDLLAALDILILERIAPGSYQAIPPLPPFATACFPQAVRDDDNMWSEDASLFLNFFWEQAEEHWAGGESGQLWSGAWTEADQDDKDTHLQAVALHVRNRRFCIVMLLNGEYQNRREIIQHARESLLLQRYLENEIEQRTESVRQREEEIVLRLVNVTNFRHEETGAHVHRIGLYAEEIAKQCGWNDIQRHKIRLAATMHDIGKVAIPDAVLLKPGPLTKAEFAIMQQHPVIGARMLEGSSIPLLQMAREIALHHHENWDGTGYPDGLAREDIPFAARIVALCDVFDALMEKRVYREPISEEKTLAIMKELRGVKFDPTLHDIFMDSYLTIAAILKNVHECPFQHDETICPP